MSHSTNRGSGRIIRGTARSPITRSPRFASSLLAASEPPSVDAPDPSFPCNPAAPRWRSHHYATPRQRLGDADRASLRGGAAREDRLPVGVVELGRREEL